MKKVLFLMFFSLNALACMDLELRDRSLKVDISWKYAPFASVSVLEDKVIYQSKKSPASIVLNWKNHPYKLTALVDINKTQIAKEGKVILTKFFGENTKTGKVKEKSKLTQLDNGKAKARFYDTSTGKYIILNFKEILLEDWVEMDCPDNSNKEEGKVLFL